MLDNFLSDPALPGGTWRLRPPNAGIPALNGAKAIDAIDSVYTSAEW